jgi:hypothetical protein
MSTYVIGVGEWMQTLSSRMETAVDGDLFVLPSAMHLHAYNILKESLFSTQDFKVEVRQQTGND